jgi:hypothetical protein
MTVFGTGHTAACHVARAELERSAKEEGVGPCP